MDLSKTHKIFLQYVKSECRRYNIKLILTEDDCFKVNGQSFGGYFAHTIPEMGITQLNDDFAFTSTLVHEFSHMEQWIDDDPTFTQHLRGGYESSTIMDNWLSGTEYEYNTIKTAINVIRDCELNCERRAIKNIKKFKLNFDEENYSQSANAYILFYNYIMTTRQWEYVKGPTEIDEIIDAMPTDLYTLDYTILLPKYTELFDRLLKKPPN